jgi:surfeit locus 1 family protein
MLLRYFVFVPAVESFMFRLMFSRRWWWTTLLVVFGVGLAIRLGFWQVGRYKENKAFADHLAAMQVAPTLVLSGYSRTDDLTGMEYRAVQATGTYDFAHQVAVRNQVWVQSWGNEMGYILVTPLVLPDGSAVLVDRGWIPLEYKTLDSWRQFDQPGPVTVSGIIRLPARPEMGGNPDPTLTPGQASMDFWNLVDISRLQKQIPNPILPVYIQQAPDPSQPGMPYRALSRPDQSTAGTNIGYAAMWFAFSMLLFAGYPLYLRGQTTDVAAPQ